MNLGDHKTYIIILFEISEINISVRYIIDIDDIPTPLSNGIIFINLIIDKIDDLSQGLISARGDINLMFENNINELTAIEITVNKLFNQLQLNFKGYSEEQHIEDLY